jgi:hypothetical protein
MWRERMQRASQNFLNWACGALAGYNAGMCYYVPQS